MPDHATFSTLLADSSVWEMIAMHGRDEFLKNATAVFRQGRTMDVLQNIVGQKSKPWSGLKALTVGGWGDWELVDLEKAMHPRAGSLTLPQGYSVLFKTTYRIPEQPGAFDRMPTIVRSTINRIIFDKSAAISVLAFAWQSMIDNWGMQVEQSFENVLPIESSAGRIRPSRTKVIICGLFRDGTNKELLAFRLPRNTDGHNGGDISTDELQHFQQEMDMALPISLEGVVQLKGRPDAGVCPGCVYKEGMQLPLLL